MIQIGFFVGHKKYEAHAEVLCKSLLAVYPEAEITAVMPLDSNIMLGYESVRNIKTIVPEDLKRLPFGDKVHAASAFEEHIQGESLWVDVDSIFIKKANFSKKNSISVNPVDKRNIGCVFPEPPSDLWHFLYDYFDLETPGFGVQTTVSREMIYPYYNIGMVYRSDQRKLMKKTRDALMDVTKSGFIKGLMEKSQLYSIFLHQAVFTCILMKLYGSEVDPLPYGLNYPLHLESENAEPIPSNDWLSIRYDHYFDTHPCPEMLLHQVGEKASKLKSVWYY